MKRITSLLELLNCRKESSLTEYSPRPTDPKLVEVIFLKVMLSRTQLLWTHAAKYTQALLKS